MKLGSTVLLLFGLSASGCDPKPGDSCERGELRCTALDRALVCENGGLIETPCRGPRGCLSSDAGSFCDIAGNHPGDRCSRDEQGAAACQDGSHLLTCRDGAIQALSCRGPGGCLIDGPRVSCDTSLGAPGDACDEGKKACSVDGDAVLECRGKKLLELYRCRGEHGCASVSGRLECDITVAALGDACSPGSEGHVACSPDAARTLICRKGRFEDDGACKAGTRCLVEGTTTRCGTESP